MFASFRVGDMGMKSRVVANRFDKKSVGATSPAESQRFNTGSGHVWNVKKHRRSDVIKPYRLEEAIQRRAFLVDSAMIQTAGYKRLLFHRSSRYSPLSSGKTSSSQPD